jgi:hypothetical protein
MLITGIRFTNHAQTKIHVCTSDIGNFIVDYPSQDPDIKAWQTIEEFVDPIKNIKWSDKNHTNYRVKMSNDEIIIFPVTTEDPLVLQWLSYNTITEEYEDERWQRYVRQQRTEKLAATDWTQLDDAELTPEQIQDYKVYRKALRDFPNQHPEVDSQESLDALVWPTPPA